MLTYGSAILAACREVKNNVVLISPYVNAFALKEFIKNIPADVQVTFISRYLPEDVLSGVCDVVALEMLRARGRCEIYLNPMLHAKIYIFDNIAFSGSANLTGKGLGLSANNNIEIMTKSTVDNTDIKKICDFLFANSIEMSEDYYNKIKELSTDKKQNFHIDTLDKEYKIWIPTSKKPLLLWDVYAGDPPQSLLGSSIRACERDLQLMGVPSNDLDKGMFYCAVKSIFANSVYFSLIQGKIAHATLSDREAIEWISSLDTTDIDSPEDSWQATKEWIRTFFPERYIIEAEAEVLKKGRVIA